MGTLNTTIISNRTNTSALKAINFTDVQEFSNWKNAVEKLRLEVSTYAVANRENASNEVLTECVNTVFSAYKIVLSAFTDKSLGDKVKCQGSDFNTLLTFIGANRKEKNSEIGKQFLPVSTTVFRKSIEDFISDRLTSAKCKTAEEIEAIKRENAKIKKAEKKTVKTVEKKVA